MSAVLPSETQFRPSEFPDSELLEGRPGLPDGPQGPSDRVSGSLPVDVLVYLGITLLVLVAWRVSQLGLFRAGDDVGYWLGVGGGVTMLMLFFYPMRKYLAFARGWGRMKGWLVIHMLLGIGGPLAILLHSTFRVGSLNAAVALYTMLAVAGSGVIGRFLYGRVNRGLHGEKASLRDLQKRAGLEEAEARSRLHFAPSVEARLATFEQRELRARANWPTYLRQVFVLPVEQWWAYRACASDLRTVLGALALRHQWKRADAVKRLKYSRRLVDQYLNAVVRVAQYNAYARLFSLWHVVHVPFIYLLVASAVVHVIAVHAY